jgi:hypothetical protein
MEREICDSGSHVFNLLMHQVNVNGKSKLLFLPHPLFPPLHFVERGTKEERLNQFGWS